MRRHLERREIESAAAEAAIASLCEDGYLDDVRYARRLAEDKRRLEGWGRERIVRDLRARGVDRDQIA
ncbi:MAG: regulatory protein, partial [Solirubrobacteraceae bacterium]|nr:regulatory protein [Solirubrobacteraceae bacterium]